jgi:hypothetical protein
VADLSKIPMFPLAIFPLPGELVPLHIFEPRYKQLLEDAEKRDFSFGIHFNHVLNTEKFGSLVKLESVIKRYSTGESDIIVRCTDLFKMNMLYRTFQQKLYPGGEVEFWNVDLNVPVSEALKFEFEAFRAQMSIKLYSDPVSPFHIANELNLDFADRLKFVVFDAAKKESFLLSRLKYQMQLLKEADKAKDVFHLN